MLLDNILDGAMMYDIVPEVNKIQSPKREVEDDESRRENSSGLEIKYANSTLRDLFKQIIKQQSMIDKMGVTFQDMEAGNEE